MSTDPAPTTPRWRPGAAALAWLLPGLGHLALGERKRGLVLMGAIVCLYTAGLLVGSISVIDRRDDRLWFTAQALAGPATFALDALHQRLRPRTETRIDRNFPDAQPPTDLTLPYVRSIGSVREIGTLYCALAGLLNLLAILDVIHRPDKPATHPAAAGPVGRVVTREEPA